VTARGMRGVGARRRRRTGAVLLPALLLATLAVPPGVPAARAAPDLTPARIAGASRLETAARLALLAAPPMAVPRPAEGVVAPETRTALVARADDPADALAAAGLAGALQAPVLLTPGDALAPVTAAALAELGVGHVVLLGAEEALSPAVADALRDRYDVERVAGPDRVATAAAAARAAAAAAGPAVSPAPGSPADPGSSAAPTARVLPATSTVFVASAAGPADALAAGALAWRGAHPLLLTAPDALPAVTADALRDLAPGEVIVLGGTAAVGDGVLAAVEATGAAVRRVGGATRQGTAALLADGGAGAPLPGRRAVFVRGDDAADALAAGPFAGAVGAPVLLTAGRDDLGAEAAAWLDARCGGLDAAQVVGGGAAVADEVLDDVLRRTRGCDRVDGEVRFRYAVAVAPSAGLEPAAVGVEVAAALDDPEGWAEPGALRFVGADVGAELTIALYGADDLAPGGPGPACAVGGGCRDGGVLAIDAAAWSTPAGAWRDEAVGEWRRWLVNHLVGLWLGLPETSCATVPVVMAPQDMEECPRAAHPAPAEARSVLERYVRPITVAVTGDIHGEGVVATGLASGDSPLRFVAPVLAAADIAVVNLETAVGSLGSPEEKQYVFRASPALLTALADAGVDVVTLANNHALDYGRDGLAETIRLAREAGLTVVGAGEDADAAYAAAVVEREGHRVAVVGLSRVLSAGWAAGPGRSGLASAYDEDAAVAAVRRAAEQADHVVVVVHWGVERAACPDAAQRRLAGLLTAAGADVVAGHHPHVLQGIEERGDAVVAYSLGNFVWYHDSGESALTGVLTARLPAAGEPYAFTPARIGPDGAPRPLEADAGLPVRAVLDARSPGGSTGCF